MGEKETKKKEGTEEKFFYKVIIELTITPMRTISNSIAILLL